MLCLPKRAKRAKRALIVQVLALFAEQPYDSELQNLGNLDAHLTNTCRLGGEAEEQQAVQLLSELPQVSHFWQRLTHKPWHLKRSWITLEPGCLVLRGRCVYHGLGEDVVWEGAKQIPASSF